MAAIVGLLMPTLPAQADNGDNRLPCNRGEICFHYIWDGFSTSTFQKHFWWSNWNHGNEWWQNIGYPCCSFPIADSASGFWNRDTQCYVRLWDIGGSGWYYYAQIPRDYMGDVAGRINNAHSRCG